MAVSNRDRVGKAFELLASGLEPFVKRTMTRRVGDGWFERFVAGSPHPDRDHSLSDPSELLTVIIVNWRDHFERQLGRAGRNLVSELKDARNKWAHNGSFTAREAYRVLDSVGLLLDSVDAHELDEVLAMQDEVGRAMFEAERKKDAARTSNVLGAAPKNLKPWRDVIFPHDDVTHGRFNVAEFAADLHLVRLGQGRPEYTDPVEFFRRTFLTSGLRQLLVDGARRIAGTGGPPVVNLQTNFGGGKTHSLIALFHLFSGVDPSTLPEEIRSVLVDAGLDDAPPTVKRAVLVGTKLTPGEPSIKDDGTAVNTLWGELAWQLGGREGYDLLAESDRNRTSPGDRLRELFERHAPCLVLIDEWVAYARDLYERDDLAGGSFDTQFTFAQSLTEAARAVDGVLFVVSVPASEHIGDAPDPEAIGSALEVGGVGGREALRRLTNVISRQAEHWRPASAEESFEIVRRRLFKPLTDAATVERDHTAETFGEMYRRERNEFPTECSDLRYVERIKAAYPVHPEVFDRLYQEWSTVERFQRTRGVLRLMASVTHALWEGNDQSPLILPASIPLDDGAVSAEITRYLDDSWKPVIDADIDGPESRPVQIDRQFENLGRYHATRRVARAIFLGSAPTVRSHNRGLEVQRVRLGSCFPGESVAVFGDALNRLSDQAPHLYVDRSRYWFDLQENVNRTAREEADRLLTHHIDEVHHEIAQRLAKAGEKGELRAVHVAPRTSDDVKDEDSARLVILGPENPHIAKAAESDALSSAKEILERRGTSPRQYKNMLVFAAADQRRLEDLERATADFLAWSRIDDEAEERNLDAYQSKQARTKRHQSDEAIRLRISEAYTWALVPNQQESGDEIEWEEHKLDTNGTVAERVSRKLVSEGVLMVQLPAQTLRIKLDGPLVSMWEGGDVRIGEVWEVLARYLYLPRLRDSEVLLATAAKGPASMTWQSEGFATAGSFEASQSRYIGLTVGSHPDNLTMASLIVRPEFALGQLEQTEAATEGGTERGEVAPGATTGDPSTTTDDAPAGPPPKTRFHGSVALSPDRMVKDFGAIAQEVIQHLTSLVDCDVEITVEVQAKRPSGFADDVIRTVTENATVLKFDSGSGFEER